MQGATEETAHKLANEVPVTAEDGLGEPADEEEPSTVTKQSLDVSDVPSPALEALRKAGYNDEDIQKYINMGTDVARVPVLSLLKLTLQEGPKGPLGAAKLVAKIDKLMTGSKYGHLSMDFEGIEYKFGVCLSMVDRGFTPQIDVPAAYVADVLEQFKSLKKTAQAYWNTFRVNNSKLIKKIDQFRSDVDFSVITNDIEAPMTMYFDPNCSKRVVVCPYYLNDKGEILSKPPMAYTVQPTKKAHGRRRKR